MFVVEYALAQLWMAWGIHPSAMIGYSIGECVAACLAGVFSLDDALVLVSERARLIQELPAGAMLAVPLPESEVQSLVSEKLSLSAVNGEAFCVVSGFPEAVVELEGRLTGQQLACRRLQTSHAFHSQMMTPIVEPFLELLNTIELKTPQIPFISTVTGTWIQDSEATDPGYWAQHLCRPVRFADGMRELRATRDQILLEVGPGQMLGSMALQLPGNDQAAETVVLASLRHSYERQSDVAFLLRTLGKLWMSGARLNWTSFYANERRHRVALPTYPFERQRCWIDRPVPLLNDRSHEITMERKRDLADWFYVPAWKQSASTRLADGPTLGEEQRSWLLFIDSVGFGHRIANRLEQAGRHVITVNVGQSFRRLGDNSYTINPVEADDYNYLFRELAARGQTPTQIVHLWTITPLEQTLNALAFEQEMQELGFSSLVFVAQALGEQGIAEPTQINVVSNNVHCVTGDEGLFPEKATLLGPCKVIPQEYQNVTCRSLDILLPEAGSRQETQLIDQLIGECATKPGDQVVALRKHNRWVQVFEQLQLASTDRPPLCLRERGVYLITGGLGGLGLAMAAYLAGTVNARLILAGRSSLPPRAEWEHWLSTHNEQDRISTRIRKVQALEQSGAEVLVVAADVTSREDMQAVVARGYERFGEINGVIHAAGVPGAGLTQLKTQESATRVIAPKVRGTLVLNEVLKDSKPDFMVLISSNISITGGLGQVDYCAANAFLDVFAQANAGGSETRVVAIDWGAWQWDDWHELLTAFGPEVQARMKQARATYGIRDDEGTEALARILRSGLPQVVVSTQDFRAIIESHANFTTSGLMNQLETIKQAKPLSIRPILGTEYVAPRNSVEQHLAEMWQKLLGIDEVGVYDNFFELGGHSLLAIQLISRLRETFQVELTLQSLLATPTIADTAVNIEEILISRIDQLTEEEAQLLLSQ
jgi:malonyl CoA-acyl carrier protein transacylase/NAD(P)-dependent dehydrogenase (short-subunit alcohol dehydrogenase family)/acyl carrier protein